MKRSRFVKLSIYQSSTNILPTRRNLHGSSFELRSAEARAADTTPESCLLSKTEAVKADLNQIVLTEAFYISEA